MSLHSHPPPLLSALFIVAIILLWDENLIVAATLAWRTTIGKTFWPAYIFPDDDNYTRGFAPYRDRKWEHSPLPHPSLLVVIDPFTALCNNLTAWDCLEFYLAFHILFARNRLLATTLRNSNLFAFVCTFQTKQVFSYYIFPRNENFVSLSITV